MIDWLSRIVFRYRYVVWMIVIPLIALSWYLVPPVEFDQTIEGFFPEDHPALLSYEKTKKAFGGDQIVFVAYDDKQLWTPEGMDRVRLLADRLAEVTGVERADAIDQMPVPWLVDEAVASAVSDTFSIFGLFRMVAGRATVSMVVRSAADDPVEQADIRKRLSAHPLFNGLLVDQSGLMTAIIVRLNASAETDRRDAVLRIRQISDEFAREQKLERVAVAGAPVLVVDGFVSLDRDNQTLGVVAMILMSITMLIAVRNPAWALLSLIAGWATWEITRIIITFFDLKLTLSAGPIIAQTVVLCMPASSHLAVRFFSILHTGLKRPETAHETLTVMFAPVAWCAVASASGYLATWAATTVQPVAQLGITMFACNLVAGALVWALSAGAMTMRLRRRRDQAATVEQGTAAVAEGVGRMTGWVLTHPGITLVLFMTPVLIAAAGSVWIEFESNYINIHKPRSRVARDYRFIEARMGGIGLVELISPAPEQMSPAWLERVAHVSKLMREENPDMVSGVVSLADLLNVPAGVKDPDAIVSWKVRILSQPKYTHFLDNLWSRNPDDNSTDQVRILVRIRESAQPELKEECFAKLLSLTQRELSEKTFITGLSHLMTQITHAVVSTSFRATIWSGLMSLAMLWMALRYLPLAMLAFAPTLLAVGLVLGIMGWIGIKVDMSTALVAGVAIGLSVDDAVHCLLRWKQELRAGRSSDEALKAAYAGSGPGVVLSSSAVSLGFLAMLYSEFVPMSSFGWLVAVATAGGSLGNLVVIPAILALVTRRSR
ncbi:MAG: MMPL family transporter [Planctomycetaceae bacterium]